MREKILSEYDSFYFLGIGGVSMSALAKILLKAGKTVGGCDRTASEYTEELTGLGVRVNICDSFDTIGYEVIVYSDAISCENRALVKARSDGKLILSRGKLLSEISKYYKRTIAISGCHGKTTCSSMLAHIFAAASRKFTCHIGGKDSTFSNCYVGGNDYLITEACEYRRNFLYLKPDIGVILNSDVDHLDCYGSDEELKNAYKRFARQSKTVISLYGDLDIGDIAVTFGFDDRADYFAKNISGVGGKFGFTVYGQGAELGRIHLQAYGKHNVLNALAAIAVARRCGIDFEYIAEGLKTFIGVKRRFEEIGTINGVRCIADYAHHPNEIKAVLKTAKQVTAGEIYVIFQPHTYSRTKNLFSQFVSVLSQVKRLLVYKTFAAREYYDDAGSALRLSKALRNARYGDGLCDISEFLSTARDGDTVLVLGAGDIYDIFVSLTDR